MRPIASLLLVMLACACATPPDSEKAAWLAAAAEQSIAAGRLDRALRFYKAATEADSHNLVIRHTLAQLYLARNQPDEALGQFAKIIDAYQDTPSSTAPDGLSPSAAFAAACAYLMADRVPSAASLLTRALQLHPHSVPLMQAQAIALYRSKKFAQAAALLLRAGQAPAGAGFPDTVEPSLLAMTARELFNRIRRAGTTGVRQTTDGIDQETLAKRLITGFPRRGFSYAALAGVLDANGDATAARAQYLQALHWSPWDPDVAHAARRFFVRQGDYAAALATWQRTVPMALLRTPQNRLRDRILRLQSATEAIKKKDTETVRVALAKAYDAMGWTEEALAVLQRNRKMGSESIASNALRRRLEAHLDFLNRLHTYMTQAYLGRLAGRTMPDTKAILAFIQQAGRMSGAVRFDVDRQVESVLFAGKEVFALNRPDSALAVYLRSHGQFLSVTQSWGAPVVKLMNLLYCGKGDSRTPGDGKRRVKYAWVICDEGRITSFAGFLANTPRIAGLTSISAVGFFIDAEALRPAYRSELYPPAADPPSPSATLEPKQQAAAALQRRFLQALSTSPTGGQDEQARFEKVFYARINKVAFHEFGHVVDLRNHLPILLHLPSNLGLAVSTGFSAEDILARAEAVAEASSLSLAAHPYLVLRDNIRWTQQDTALPYWFMLVSPGALRRQFSPYRAAGQDLLHEVLERAEQRLRAGGRLEASVPVMLQLPKLSTDELKAIGAAICRAWGLN